MYFINFIQLREMIINHLIIIFISLWEARRSTNKIRRNATPTNNSHRNNLLRKRNSLKTHIKISLNLYHPRKFRTVQVLPLLSSLQFPLRALQVRQRSSRMRSLPLQIGANKGHQIPSRFQARTARTRQGEEINC